MEEFLISLWASIGEWIVSFGGKLLLGLLLLIVGIKLSKWLVKKIINSKALAKNPDMHSFLGSALTAIAYVLVIVMVITIWGVPTASVVAVIASCGLAIGMALQGSLSNLAGGLMIILFHPFHVRDYIDNGTYQGTVEDIGIFYTTVVTIDNRKVVLPNATVSNSALVNVTAKDLRRVDLAFEVEVNADKDKVVAALCEAATQCEFAILEPAPFVGLSEVKGGCAIYTFRTWTTTKQYWDAYFDLQARAKKALEQNEVAISFPKTAGITK